MNAAAGEARAASGRMPSHGGEARMAMSDGGSEGSEGSEGSDEAWIAAIKEMADEGVPASLLAEAARAAQVRDALQAERQENATLHSACGEKTKEALRVLVEEERSAEHFSVPIAGGRTLPPGEARAATAACRATAAKPAWQ